MTVTTRIPPDEAEARRRAVVEFLAMRPRERDAADFDDLVDKHLTAVRCESSYQTDDERSGLQFADEPGA